MNHLAHCYLSFGQEDWLTGNFMGDYIKGDDWQSYPEGIQQGILIHRQIDAFTDAHPLIKQGMHRIRPLAKRYAGPIYDILCDHLLSRSWSKHVPHQSLDHFAEQTYAMLLKRIPDFPVPLQERVPRMVGGDFLRGYSQPEHLLWVFGQFAKRLHQTIDFAALLDFFMSEIEVFQSEFEVFFPEMEQHLRSRFNIIRK